MYPYQAVSLKDIKGLIIPYFPRFVSAEQSPPWPSHASVRLATANMDCLAGFLSVIQFGIWAHRELLAFWSPAASGPADRETETLAAGEARSSTLFPRSSGKWGRGTGRVANRRAAWRWEGPSVSRSPTRRCIGRWHSCLHEGQCILING